MKKRSKEPAVKVGDEVTCTECGGHGYKARPGRVDYAINSIYGNCYTVPLPPIVCLLCKGTRKTKVVAQ